MIYYRLALKIQHSSLWQWKSTKITSLTSLMQLIKIYKSTPKNEVRIFFSSSETIMDFMLNRANHGLTSNSLTLEQFLANQMRIDTTAMKRLELELASLETTNELPVPVKTGKLRSEASYEKATMKRSTNYDEPYVFTLPISLQERLAWTRLLRKVRNGELVP
jgi:hypothetical protein